MKIVLLGYGKMGKEIEQVALSMGHEIVLKIGKENLYEFTSDHLGRAEVVIEFTQPAAAFYNISKCFDSGIPVVSGTTGWYDQLGEVKELCEMKNGSLLYASNFSIGVNLFFELNRKLALLMNPHKEYNVSLEEIHHTQKLDKPSGTALTLAKEIINVTGSKKSITVNDSLKNDKDHLFINAVRKDNVVGIHQVKYESSIDKIEIKHEAFSRKGFAQGAVLAAQWLVGKKGFFEMKDFLKAV
ncbi:MAG: 4-hydroxy-tetrahydrodipicolinate reductase [Bacteroidia bacterium]